MLKNRKNLNTENGLRNARQYVHSAMLPTQILKKVVPILKMR
jgi:hypothetical protein